MAEKQLNWAQRLKAPEVKFPKGIFSFYLSHATDSRSYVRKWELGFEKRHPKIAMINPFYDLPGEQERRVRAIDQGKEFKEEPGFEWRMTQGDYIAICYSRGILCIVDENYDKSIGTVMEMVMARTLAKNPKLLVCTNKKLIEHPWLKTHFHKIYTSFEEFEKDVDYQVERVKKKWGF
ncbi:hypothetical protein J4233_05370 [Candidatus Pacearchaeota archaeon]|nr:hypothetical protein [uncultured archaeon]AQS28874.1 hypothetical protein [uncultured archaeon]MBS3077670.1 hypothetical protein [Candidatus Pacearchaeota archaeon]